MRGPAPARDRSGDRGRPRAPSCGTGSGTGLAPSAEAPRAREEGAEALLAVSQIGMRCAEMWCPGSYLGDPATKGQPGH